MRNTKHVMSRVAFVTMMATKGEGHRSLRGFLPPIRTSARTGPRVHSGDSHT